MDLLIDLGNSRLKWRLESDPPQKGTVTPGFGGADPVAGQWSQLRCPDRVVVASVRSAEDNQRLREWIARQWGTAVVFARTSASCCGVANGYHRPERLGVDRWLALIGARALGAEPALVIDCGTAVTADLLGPGGVHLGGWVIPGLRLMRESLLGGTHGIQSGGRLAPIAEARFGHDTDECIGYGAVETIRAMIERASDLATQLLEATPHCLITGGDGPAIANTLTVPCRVESDLVLTGLARYARELATES